jgi:cellulose synthase/poly-beta-1,6-N-acetylglucosamine synthase-like glycosyltransferase
MDLDTQAPNNMWPATPHGRWMSEKYEAGLVSVIVPTFNREKYLVEAMDSVYAQTYQPVELLIVDDGSTDDTARVVEEWGCTHGGDDFALRYFRQENAGAPAARNLGLIESRGEAKKIKLGNNLWIGTHAVILDDVSPGTVVGAGAVVTKMFPPDSIISGVPARLIRARGIE